MNNISFISKIECVMSILESPKVIKMSYLENFVQNGATVGPSQICSREILK